MLPTAVHDFMSGENTTLLDCVNKKKESSHKGAVNLK
jgi:hypothetical protein